MSRNRRHRPGTSAGAVVVIVCFIALALLAVCAAASLYNAVTGGLL